MGNVLDGLYQPPRPRAQKNGRSLDEEAKGVLREPIQEPASLPILALRGLGKHIWRGVGVARYVAKGRRSWD